MVTISLCMIVKNEEMHIARCLDSIVELVEEIIIVDTGSTDRTVEIVSGYTSKVYSYPWKDDFSDARNYSFSKASMDYCMWMDADDVLEETQKEKFLQLKQSMSPDTDIVMMKYNTSFDEAGAPSLFQGKVDKKQFAVPLGWCGSRSNSAKRQGNIFRYCNQPQKAPCRGY